MQAGEFEEGVVGLCAAVAEKDATRTRPGDEPVGQPLLLRDAVKVTAVGEDSCLLLHGLDPLRVGMSD